MKLSLLLSILVCLFSTTVVAENYPAEQYREDIDAFVDGVKARHVDPFAKLTEAEFDARAAALKARAAELSFNEFIVEMARLGAALGEGHTGIMPAFDRTLDLKILPVELWPATDGWTILATLPEHSALLGAHVTHIGDAPVKEIADAMAPLYSRDTDTALPKGIASLARTPALLEGAGVVAKLEDADTIRVVTADGAAKVNMRRISKFNDLGRVTMNNFVAAGDPAPLWLKNRQTPWWRTTIDDGKVMYLQFNSADTGRNDEWTAENFIAFSRQLASDVVADPKINKLIIDLRWNAGGSYSNTRGLLADILSTQRFAERGQLFIITSSITFSAAIDHLSAFERWMDPVVVGEAGAGRPGHRAELGRFRLPNTQLEVRVSTVNTTDSTEHRPSFFPHLFTPFTSAALKEGRDPALEAILAFDPNRSLKNSLSEALAQGGAPALVARYDALKARERAVYIFEERVLNEIGYHLLREQEKPLEALQVFQLNAREYPYSPFVYDSLGDAYRALGENKKAIMNYRKAMAIDARFRYAVPIVDELEG